MKSTESIQGKITYDKLFWLFMAGSLTGVVLEGLFCLILKGHWESHVVTILGPFNALYGAGAVLFYSVAALLKDKNIVLKVALITAIATVLELLCGILLADGLGMKAWDYSKVMFNYRGIICLSFSLGWGGAGLAFCLLFDKIDRLFCKLKGKKTHLLCIVLSVLMVINLCLTAVCIVRWSERHYHTATNSKLGKLVDEAAPDQWMQHRFIEWEFIDEKTK
ncbi:MAG: putative ABC transporter permease [Clostridia bacterium]|nr:putative ABC transporter permease [Clostridia bacterium]